MSRSRVARSDFIPASHRPFLSIQGWMRIPSSTAVEGRHADIMNTSCGWPQCLLQEGPRTMANVRRMTFDRKIDYPTSDGRPMAETDWHRDLMFALIAILKMWYAKAR